MCVYFLLATRLYPTHFGGFNTQRTTPPRLFVPVGYWNALGIFAGIALLLGFGCAAFGRIAWLRVSSAAAMVVLAPTMYFTFSRGGSSVRALPSGSLAMFLRLVRPVLRYRGRGNGRFRGRAAALAVLLASRAAGTDAPKSATLAEASHDGRHLAFELAALVLAQAALALAYVFASQKISVPTLWRRAFGAAIAVAIVASLAGVIERYGSPSTIAHHAYQSFQRVPPVSGANLNGRLLSFSNNGRIVLWHSAWKEFLAHPIAGSGEGGFARWWLAHRATTYFVMDTQFTTSYLTDARRARSRSGTLGLLALFLGVPLVAALRARRHPLVAPAAFGAYVAYLAHAAVDWDWQMAAAVTLLALFAGAMVVAAARRVEPAPRPMKRAARIALGASRPEQQRSSWRSRALMDGNLALSRADAAVSRTGQMVWAGKKRLFQKPPRRARLGAVVDAGAEEILGDGRLASPPNQSCRTRGAPESRRQADPSIDWETWFDIAAGTEGAEHRARRLPPPRKNAQPAESRDCCRRKCDRRQERLTSPVRVWHLPAVWGGSDEILETRNRPRARTSRAASAATRAIRSDAQSAECRAHEGSTAACARLRSRCRGHRRACDVARSRGRARQRLSLTEDVLHQRFTHLQLEWSPQAQRPWSDPDGDPFGFLPFRVQYSFLVPLCFEGPPPPRHTVFVPVFAAIFLLIFDPEQYSPGFVLGRCMGSPALDCAPPRQADPCDTSAPRIGHGS